MNSFPSIEKLDTIILYILELASSLSVLLLAFGLIASVANVLTNGATLTNHSWAQEAYAWTQAVAIDASVAGVIIRTFQYRKEGQRIKMWLYAVLSCLLLFTAAIVSNIESIQQTLSAAFLIGATLKNKAIWLYKSIFIVITNEERSISGSLLTRVKKSCRERWVVPVQANEEVAARREVGAVPTSRSNNAAA